MGHRLLDRMGEQLLVGKAGADQFALAALQREKKRLSGARVFFREQLDSGVVVFAKNFQGAVVGEAVLDHEFDIPIGLPEDALDTPPDGVASVTAEDED